MLSGERLTDRFENQPVRDSDSVNVLPGFEFKPTALVSGKVSVGFRRFDAIDRPCRTSRSSSASSTLDIRGASKRSSTFKAIRNIEYSIEETQPYFVTNGGGLEVTQGIGLNWFVAARV